MEDYSIADGRELMVQLCVKNYFSSLSIFMLINDMTDQAFNAK